MKILIIGGVPQSLIRFRGQLINRLVSLGHEVVAMSGDANEAEFSHEVISAALAERGVEFVSYPLQRKSVNPLSDLNTMMFFVRCFRRHRADLVIAYTVKPVIWGGLAARIAGVPKFHALVTGLGNQFSAEASSGELVQRVIRHLYKLSLARASGVMFQNQDDLDTFLGKRIISADRAHVVPGSGVDLNEFRQQPMPEGPPVFVCIARLLEAKGLRLYAEVAKRIKAQNPEVRFLLAGEAAEGSAAIPLEEVEQWSEQGVVEFLGRVRDIQSLLGSAHVFVLPSYYGEGLPRTILEALAVGRPVLTTDNVGCREGVVDGENGKLIQPRSVDTLLEGVSWFLKNQDQWPDMANSSRRLAENRFDVELVNDAMVSIMEVGNTPQ